jgi:hypothetical protein
MHWIHKAIWNGKTVAIAAGGPSFTAAQARAIGMARARSRIKVIAVNDSVYPCWFADIAYASDAPWWRHHGNLPGFEGRRVGLRHEDGPGRFVEPSEIAFVEASGVEGYDARPGFVRHGGNSGYAALHLAAQLGAVRVILLGYDMHGEHWFGNHPDGVRRATVDKSRWVRRFEALGAELRALGIEIANANPDSAIRCFPFEDVDKLLR